MSIAGGIIATIKISAPQIEEQIVRIMEMPPFRIQPSGPSRPVLELVWSVTLSSINRAFTQV